MANMTADDAERHTSTVEALARRGAAEASVFSAMASIDPKNAGMFQKLAAERSKAAGELSRRALKLRAGGPVLDPEGTAYPYADRRGSYAETADIANQGGIG